MKALLDISQLYILQYQYVKMQHSMINQFLLINNSHFRIFSKKCNTKAVANAQATPFCNMLVAFFGRKSK